MADTSENDDSNATEQIKDVDDSGRGVE